MILHCAVLKEHDTSFVVVLFVDGTKMAQLLTNSLDEAIEETRRHLTGFYTNALTKN